MGNPIDGAELWHVYIGTVKTVAPAPAAAAPHLPTLDLVISMMLGCFILALWLVLRVERGYARRVRPHVVHLITVRAGDCGAIG